MKKLIALISVMVLLLALLLAGCSLDTPADPTDQVNPPDENDIPAPFGAIGNSLTAGYMDTGLREEGQANSVPMLIAQQMGLSAAQFTQPTIAAPGIGTTNVGEGNVASSMHFDGFTIKLMEIFPVSEVPARLLNARQLVPYHNMGVPGAWAQDVMSAYDKGSSFGAKNSFFDFINRAEVLFGNEEDSATYPTGPESSKTVIFQTSSQFRQAIAVGPRLCTLWIGGNDIYLAATSGNPNDLANGGLPITPVPAFQESFTDMLALLAGGLAARTGWNPETGAGTQPTIVVANLPSMTSVPHFIPTALFEMVIGGSPGYDEGVVDYVLLPALSWVQDPANQGLPLPSTLTLTPAEVALIQGSVDGYNQVIQGVAAQINASGTAKVGMVDANAFLEGLPNFRKTHFLFLLPPHAPPWDAAEIATAAATTYFSLDGFHPNNLGYGAIANEFIKVINTLDGTSIPELTVENLVWDPTYGVTTSPTAVSPGSLMTQEAARALSGMFK